MPELPEVETTRRSLEPHVVGKPIRSAQAMRPDLRFPLPPLLSETLANNHIVGIRRRAKYLLFDLASGHVMLWHLGMSGSLMVVKNQDYVPRKHDHVRVYFYDETVMVYHDPRRFGFVGVMDKNDEKTNAFLKNLGPEPLEKRFSATYLRAALSTRHGPIKPVLMDQSIVVGVGNIYASESLFLAGIHPATPANEIFDACDRLVPMIKKTLRAAIASGGSTLRDYVHADGGAGYFQHHFNVYERKGLPCFFCGDAIQMMTQAGRTSYFCLQCQRTKNTSLAERKKSSQKRLKKPSIQGQ